MYDALEHCEPTSFISINDGIATRLQVLSNDTLLDNILRSCASVSRAQRTKAGLTRLIMEDFTGESGREISEQLLLPPSSVRKSEKEKQLRRENHMSSVVSARETRDEYICSWPQTVPKTLCSGVLMRTIMLLN